MRYGMIVVLVVALLMTPALAKDDPVAMAKEAAKLAQDGSLVDAVAKYCTALRIAEKRKDLPAQEAVTESLQHALSRASMRASDRDLAGRAALQAMLEGLDPKRTSPFLCRGQVAHALLMDATRTGERDHVKAAAAAATAYAKLPKTGAFAKAMAAYGGGLTFLEDGKLELACARLQAALDKTAAEGWATVTMHVATELAAAQLQSGQEAKAAAALAKAGDVLKGSGDYAVASLWRRLVEKRLPRASKTVLAAYETAMKPHKKGGSASAAGGSGGKGQPAGSRDRSKIGKAWKKLSKKKPFVTVRRTGAGYEIRQSYDKKFEATQSYEKGVKHHADGGVTLSFWEFGVRLNMVDMRGLAGQPGDASEPPAFMFFHPLAMGETWGVTKIGTVVITSK